MKEDNYVWNNRNISLPEVNKDDDEIQILDVWWVNLYAYNTQSGSGIGAAQTSSLYSQTYIKTKKSATKRRWKAWPKTSDYSNLPFKGSNEWDIPAAEVHKTWYIKGG